ncbi:MAG TPA: MgtC/SapB family protein [Steroidobacteraceae bacterium]|nr:MgtC/SapB family protein [Steroidobacteraceae bacterium]
MTMSLELTWSDVALRLALTVLAGIAIGYDRSEHGKAAGLRTVVLVCLAASVAMIQVNALLPMMGRGPTSFVMNDLMRLPLGILTGVGFIGGGAILRRDNFLVGVTTAATLWIVTVIGLCLGGGQIALGLTATALVLLALWGLRWFEDRMRREHHARLSVELDASGPAESEIRRRLEHAGLAVIGMRCALERTGTQREFQFEVSQMRRFSASQAPPLLGELALEPGVIRVQWDGIQ